MSVLNRHGGHQCRQSHFKSGGDRWEIKAKVRAKAKSLHLAVAPTWLGDSPSAKEPGHL